jgi:hypothetical protein
MIEFIRGAWTAERITLTPAAWNTASKVAVKLESPVVQDELDPGPCVFQVHEQVPGLLHHPGLGRVLDGAEDPDAAGAVLDDGQDVDLGAVEQVGGEEVQRQDPLRLGPQEFSPPWAVPAGRRFDPGALEDPPHRRWRHGDAEPGQLAVDPAVTPRLVLPGQPKHHRPDITVRRRATGPALVRQARPAAADDVAVPPHDGARSHDQPHPGQALDGQRPG